MVFSPVEQDLINNPRSIAWARPMPANLAGAFLPPRGDFPYELMLLGYEKRLEDEHIEARPLGISSLGETLLAHNVYATVSEVVAVGQAFPAHPFYRAWFESIEEELKTAYPPRIQEVGLTAVRLVVRESLLGEVSDHSEINSDLLQQISQEPPYWSYPFALGSRQEPIVICKARPEVHAQDLPTINLEAYRKIVNELRDELSSSGPVRTCDVFADPSYFIEELELGSLHPRATEHQLTLGNMLAGALARLKVEDQDSPEYAQNIEATMRRLFGESFVEPSLQEE